MTWRMQQRQRATGPWPVCAAAFALQHVKHMISAGAHSAVVLDISARIAAQYQGQGLTLACLVSAGEKAQVSGSAQGPKDYESNDSGKVICTLVGFFWLPCVCQQCVLGTKVSLHSYCPRC